MKDEKIKIHLYVLWKESEIWDQLKLLCVVFILSNSSYNVIRGIFHPFNRQTGEVLSSHSIKYMLLPPFIIFFE